MTKTLTHIEALSQLAATGKPFVVVTLIDVQGSTPQDAGTKMLVDGTGLAHGTVGGGKVEHRAIEHATQLLTDPSRNREIVDWNLQRDIGMTCGGVVKLFFEVHNRDHWDVVIFGAGHVSQALIKVLLNLDCRVTCIDSRNEWIARLPDHARLTKKCVGELVVEAEKLVSTDFVVCMTMGHSTDRPVLATIFQRQIKPAYLGVIGSRTKRGALVRELQSEDGIDEATANAFLCPIGLPLGSNQPSEIAISIAAQLLQYRDKMKSAQEISKPGGASQRTAEQTRTC